MPNYVFAYHGNGNMPKTPEEGAAHMQRYKAWLEGMGDAVVNPGTPFKDSKTVAQASPFLEMGTIEVAEIIHM